MFREKYADVFSGEESWRSLPIPEGEIYAWEDHSTYVQEPSFFEVRDEMSTGLEGFSGARLLALLGDSITTDHISPAGSILASSPAGVYLRERDIGPADFNSYGSRRGNHEVMMRGTFANIRLKNELVPGVEGGFTKVLPGDKQVSIFDAAMQYAEAKTPLIIIGGKEYGTGSSRDWAAKGTLLLGVKAVVTESYERIHRSNLVGMGILPLQFKGGDSRKTLGIDGSETFDLIGQVQDPVPGQDLTLRINRADGSRDDIVVTCRIDTFNEVQYFQSGGILNYVLRNLMK
jgi:aconitate hydratase